MEGAANLVCIGIASGRALRQCRLLVPTWLSCFKQAPPKRSYPSGVSFCLQLNSVSQRLFRWGKANNERAFAKEHNALELGTHYVTNCFRFIHAPLWQRWQRRTGGDAHKAVLRKLELRALHINILACRKIRTYKEQRGSTNLYILAERGFIGSF